jgi:thiopeptide-type bacteriocin biosynthesis protein
MQQWQWIQLNVGLMRYQNEALSSARKLFTALDSPIRQWREAGQLQCFFFMRKPPDVRLRFLTHEPQVVLSQLTTLSNELLLQGIIHEHFLSEYEPEGDRFGGSQTLPLVHTYFDVDTTQWLCLDRLKQQSKPAIPEITLLAAVLQDLFESTQMTADAVLLTWHILRQRFDLPLRLSSLPSDLPFVSLQTLRSSVGHEAEVESILDAYLTANREMAQQLNRLWNEGKVDGTLPDLLANVGQFTLHRHGFSWQGADQVIGLVLGSLEAGQSPLYNPTP